MKEQKSQKYQPVRDEQSLPSVLKPSKSISRRGQLPTIMSDVSTDSPLPLCCP